MRRCVARIHKLSQRQHRPQMGMQMCQLPVGATLIRLAMYEAAEGGLLVVVPPRGGGEAESRVRGDQTRAKLVVLPTAEGRIEAADSLEQASQIGRASGRER